MVHGSEIIMRKAKQKLSLQQVGKFLQISCKFSSWNSLATKGALYVILLSFYFCIMTHVTKITFWPLSLASSYTLCLAQFCNSTILACKTLILLSVQFASVIFSLTFLHILILLKLTLICLSSWRSFMLNQVLFLPVLLPALSKSKASFQESESGFNLQLCT